MGIYSLGVDGYCAVDGSVGWICEESRVAPELLYTGAGRGWVGDSSSAYLYYFRIRSLEWRPSRTIHGPVQTTSRCPPVGVASAAEIAALLCRRRERPRI